MFYTEASGKNKEETDLYIIPMNKDVQESRNSGNEPQESSCNILSASNKSSGVVTCGIYGTGSQ